MFSKFKLNKIDYNDVYKYKKDGDDYYKEIKTDIKNSLIEFVGEDGIIDGTELQKNWFPIKRTFDVFLSHSHNDESLAISLAGFLKKELDLDTFIDSCLWGYSNDLLRELDEKYCRSSSDCTLFDYDKRNYSTSHVHMMLSIALSRMIDNCEAVFFLNSENSISLKEDIDECRTMSPWIYSELSLADMIRTRSINYYRSYKVIERKFKEYEVICESAGLKIGYKVDKILNNFIDLSYGDLVNCKNKWEYNEQNFQCALDYIYLYKNIISRKI